MPLQDRTGQGTTVPDHDVGLLSRSAYTWRRGWKAGGTLEGLGDLKRVVWKEKGGDREVTVDLVETSTLFTTLDL